MNIKLLSTALLFFIASPFILGQNYYLGVGNGNDAQGTSCSSCHKTGGIGQPPGVTGKYNEWKTTAHSWAQDSLSSNPAFGYDCLQCHNTGWDTGIDNYGADEYVKKDTSTTPNYKITDQAGWNRVKNVQCETCHGPLGTKNGTLSNDHWGYQTGVSNVPNYSASLCGTCHQGSHHPYYEEWQMSKHAVSNTQAFIVNNKSCVKCHVAQNFVAYAKNPAAYKDTILVTGKNIMPLTCVTCHDPHENKYPGQLRFAVSGTSVICDQCHKNDIDSVDINTAPHHTTSEALSGSKNFGYRYPGETYENSAHTFAATKRCINCHVNMSPNADGSVSTGHTFEPRVQACATCHKNYYSLVDTSNHAKRFDLYGAQTKTDSLMKVLQDKLNTASTADSQSVEFKEANYNLLSVQAEGSNGIHNTRLVQKLLTDAISHFNPTSVEHEPSIAKTYRLSQNYPNPFNPTTSIKFSIPQASQVKIVVYDALGRVVTTLIDSYLNQGSYNVDWNASTYSSGVYFYRIEAKNFNMVKKMVLLK